MRKQIVLLLGVVLLIACSRSSIPSEQETRTAYDQWKSRVGCPTQISGFRKVNGTEKAPRMLGPGKYYAIEFEAEENRKPCWNRIYGSNTDKITIGGEVYFIQTENGWKPVFIVCGEKTNNKVDDRMFCTTPL